MKKLILAPAVALALTGLVAAPVAAETPSTQSDSAQAEANAEQVKADKLAKEKKAAEEKAEKEKAAEAAEKKAEAKKAAAKKAAAEEAAAKKEAAEDAADKKKADETASADAEKSKKPAPKADDSKDSRKHDGSDAEDEDKKSKDSATPKDDVEKIDASLKVDTAKIAAEDLGDPAKGVKVTVNGLEKGDTISVAGLEAPATTASGSTATLRLHYVGDVESLKDGTKNFSLKVARQGVSTKTLSGSTQVEAKAADKADPKVSPSATTISADELSEEGVDITGSGFTEESNVLFFSELGDAEGTTSDSNGDVEANFKPELGRDFKPGVYSVTVFDGLTETGDGFELRVTAEGEADPIDASLTVDPKEITAEDLANKDKGVAATVSGVKKGDKITDSLTGKTETVEADGDYKLNLYYTGDASDLQEGTSEPFTIDTEREGTKSVTLNGEINIVAETEEDAVDPIDVSLKVDPKEITAADLANKDKGVTVTVSGVKAGDKVTDSLTDKTETADADGDYKLHLYYKGNPDSLEEGKVPFSVTIDREGTESETLKGNINVVAEDSGDDGDEGDKGDTSEAPAEASFSVSPKVIEAADFANEKKGVTLAVENCEPGASVHFAVTPKGIQVTAYENTVKADDEGKASVNVFGTSDNVSAYVGSYTASATCGDDSMKGSFKVTEGANGGRSDDGSDGSQLPRTGADLGGIASGAILLLVGGAAIAMTGRRKKVGQSPSDF